MKQLSAVEKMKIAFLNIMMDVQNDRNPVRRFVVNLPVLRDLGKQNLDTSGGEKDIILEGLKAVLVVSEGNSDNRQQALTMEEKKGLYELLVATGNADYLHSIKDQESNPDLKQYAVDLIAEMIERSR
jgi:hypothetical protein